MLLIFISAVLAGSVFNGIDFSVDGDHYNSNSCAIDDDFVYSDNRTISLAFCSTQCLLSSQNYTTIKDPARNVLCTSYAYNHKTFMCYYFDRSIATLNVISESGVSCGFYLTTNQYCTDDNGVVTCNVPNNKGATVAGVTSGMFQGMKFAAAGDVYSLASAKINENYILSQVITDEPDCVAKCQSMKDCTGYSIGDLNNFSPTCYLYDRSIDNLSFNTDVKVKGYNCGFLLSRSPQCYNNGTAVSCNTPPPTGSNIPTISSTPSNPSMSSTLQLLLEIGIPVVVFVLVLTGFGLFWYQRKSKKLDLDNEFSKTPASVTSSTTASVEQLHNEFRNFDPTKTPLMDPQMVAWNSQTNLQPRYMAEGELPHLLPPEKNYPIVQPPILADTMQKETIIVDNSDDILPDLPLILNDPPTIDPTTIDTTTIDPPTIDPPSIDPPFSDDTKPMIVVIEKPDYTDNPEN